MLITNRKNIFKNKSAKTKLTVFTFSFLICLFLLYLFLAKSVSASDDLKANKLYEKDTLTADTSDFIKSDFNPKYGVIKLSTKSADKLAEYSLTDCSAQGKVTWLGVV